MKIKATLDPCIRIQETMFYENVYVWCPTFLPTLLHIFIDSKAHETRQQWQGGHMYTRSRNRVLGKVCVCSASTSWDPAGGTRLSMTGPLGAPPGMGAPMPAAGAAELAFIHDATARSALTVRVAVAV